MARIDHSRILMGIVDNKLGSFGPSNDKNIMARQLIHARIAARVKTNSFKPEKTAPNAFYHGAYCLKDHPVGTVDRCKVVCKDYPLVDGRTTCFLGAMNDTTPITPYEFVQYAKRMVKYYKLVASKEDLKEVRKLVYDPKIESIIDAEAERLNHFFIEP